MRTEGGTGDSHAQTIDVIIKMGLREAHTQPMQMRVCNLAAAPDDDSEQPQLE
jgi:hypothetical protein